MKTYAFLLGVTAFGIIAATAIADAGQRVVVGPYGGTKTVTAGVDEYGASRSVTTGSVVGPRGGVYNRTVIRNW